MLMAVVEEEVLGVLETLGVAPEVVVAHTLNKK
jgi:hypothetical protein